MLKLPFSKTIQIEKWINKTIRYKNRKIPNQKMNEKQDVLKAILNVKKYAKDLKVHVPSSDREMPQQCRKLPSMSTKLTMWSQALPSWKARDKRITAFD